MPYRISLAKENFKFSCSHFTIFGSTEAERLHGHNYYVLVDLELTSLDQELGMAFDFNLVKPVIRRVADSLDELVLLPSRSNHLKIEAKADRVRATFATGKMYDLPAEDVKILPVVNVTSEELARFFAEELTEELKKVKEAARIRSISIGIEETRGQTVYFEQPFKT